MCRNCERGEDRSFANYYETALGRRRFLLDLKAVETEGNMYWNRLAVAIRLQKANYIGWSVDDPSRVAYSGSGVHRLDHSRRRVTTVHRYITRILKLGDIPEHQAESFAYRMQALRPEANDTMEVIKKGIVAAFENEFGGHSCMTGGCAEYVQVYEENDNIQLLKYTSFGGKRARAVVWTTDKGETILDRIYPNSGAHIDRIHGWAKEQGWLIRETNGLPEGDVRISDGKRHTVSVTSDSGMWPYMDTFRFADGDESEATLSNWDSGNAVLESTDGGFIGHYMRCENCSERYDENDLTTIDDVLWCENCLCDEFSWSETECEYVRHDDCVTLDCGDIVSTHYAESHCYTCDSCDHVSTDDTSETPDGKQQLCESCFNDVVSTCDSCSTEIMCDELDDDGNCSECSVATCETCSEKVPSEAVDDDGNCDCCKVATCGSCSNETTAGDIDDDSGKCGTCSEASESESESEKVKA